jgi:hypothetical protein
LKNFCFLDSLETDISKLIEEHAPCHLFLDEVPADKLTPEFWVDIHKSFPKEKNLWVAYRADMSPRKEDINGIIVINNC